MLLRLLGRFGTGKGTLYATLNGDGTLKEAATQVMGALDGAAVKAKTDASAGGAEPPPSGGGRATARVS